MKVAVEVKSGGMVTKFEVGTLTGKTKKVPNRKWGGTITQYEVKVSDENSIWSRSAYIYFDVGACLKYQEAGEEYRRLAKERQERVTLQDVEKMVNKELGK